jgi:broad specificity phosphatase PhoE
LTRIILIRHGQTAWHSDGVERAEGRADVDLDEVGVRQARATATRLDQWEISAVYSSPLKRALSTASILAARQGLTPQPDPGLIDIDYGRWQGLTHKEAQTNNPGLYDLWMKKPHLVAFPGGESLADVRNRMVGTFESLTSQHDGRTIVLVSHKVVVKVLLCHVLGLDDSHFWRFQQGFCALNVIEADQGSAAVHLVNDACHLERLG